MQLSVGWCMNELNSCALLLKNALDNGNSKAGADKLPNASLKCSLLFSTDCWSEQIRSGTDPHSTHILISINIWAYSIDSCFLFSGSFHILRRCFFFLIRHLLLYYPLIYSYRLHALNKLRTPHLRVFILSFAYCSMISRIAVYKLCPFF